MRVVRLFMLAIATKGCNVLQASVGEGGGG